VPSAPVKVDLYTHGFGLVLALFLACIWALLGGSGAPPGLFWFFPARFWAVIPCAWGGPSGPVAAPVSARFRAVLGGFWVVFGVLGLFFRCGPFGAETPSGGPLVGPALPGPKGPKGPYFGPFGLFSGRFWPLFRGLGPLILCLGVFGAPAGPPFGGLFSACFSVFPRPSGPGWLVGGFLLGGPSGPKSGPFWALFGLFFGPFSACFRPFGRPFGPPKSALSPGARSGPPGPVGALRAPTGPGGPRKGPFSGPFRLFFWPFPGPPAQGPPEGVSVWAGLRPAGDPQRGCPPGTQIAPRTLKSAFVWPPGPLRGPYPD